MSVLGSVPGYVLKVCVAVCLVCVFVQVRLARLGVSPIAVSLVGGMPDLPSLAYDNRLSGIVEKIGEGDLLGPESLAVSVKDGNEFIFAALGDGRIVRIDLSDPSSLSWKSVIRTGSDDDEQPCGQGGPTDDTNTELRCGRPLGIAIVKRSSVDASFEHGGREEDVLVVLDPSGLLMIDNIYETNAKPTKHVLATHAHQHRTPLRLLNAIVQAPDGALYFTQTSTHFHRRRIFHAFFDGRPTGRLLRYTKQHGVHVMRSHIYMPNGLTLSHDRTSLIIVSGIQLLTYHIPTDTLQLFVHAMPGTGDNIKTATHLPTGQPADCYWAALGSKCAQPFCLFRAIAERPNIRSLLLSLLPYKALVNAIPKFSGFAVYDTHGHLIETYQDTDAVAPWLAQAEPVGDYIYLASWYNDFLGRVKRQDLVAASPSIHS